MNHNMKKISESDFASEVIQKDGIQVVHFYNPYSDYSDANDNMLEELYKTHNDASFFHLNLLHAETLCERYGIAMPSVLIFEDGMLQDLLQGLVDRNLVGSKIDSLSAKLQSVAQP